MISSGRPRRRALSLAMLIAAFALVGTGSLQAGPSPARVVLRNDGFPLPPELAIGRFGAGRLLFDHPSDVVVDDDKNVFVLDQGNNRVQVLDENGKFRSEWKLKADRQIERDGPAALACLRKDGTLFVLDGDAARVQQYRPDGSLILTFGLGGLSSGRMDRPVDLDVDPLGNVYVLDQGRKKVLKWHRSGAFSTEWGEQGSGEQQFMEPVSIAFSEEGLGIIFVLDRGRRALLGFSTDGRFRSALDLGDFLAADGPLALRLAVDENDDIFIVEGTKWKLIKLDKRTVSVYSLEARGVAGGLAVDRFGRLYIADRKASKLLRFKLEMD